MTGGAKVRAKGRAGEREVADIYTAAGLTVRNLEGLGDHLVMTPSGITLHSEAKRHERVQMPWWQKQALAECPQGVVPVIAWRQSNMPWWGALPLTDLAVILGSR